MHKAILSCVGPCWGHTIQSGWACAASGNATQVWQNPEQDKTRLAINIGLGCQSNEARIVDILQQAILPGLTRTMWSPIPYGLANYLILFSDLIYIMQ